MHTPASSKAKPVRYTRMGSKGRKGMMGVKAKSRTKDEYGSPKPAQNRCSAPSAAIETANNDRPNGPIFSKRNTLTTRLLLASRVSLGSRSLLIIELDWYDGKNHIAPGI